MEKGFNTDIHFMGTMFHVQTEDWGLDKPFLVTRVFKNGAVIKTIKRSYDQAIEARPSGLSQSLRLAMREQHEEILDLINSGQI